jgi:hypothetical protein
MLAKVAPVCALQLLALPQYGVPSLQHPHSAYVLLVEQAPFEHVVEQPLFACASGAARITRLAQSTAHCVARFSVREIMSMPLV